MMAKSFFRSLALALAILLLLSQLTVLLAAKAEEYVENGLRYTVENGEATLFNIESVPADGKLTVPESLGGFPVTAIRFCHGIAGLTELTVPACVTHIDNHSFSSCPDLRAVHLHDKLEYLGRGVFEFTPLFYDENSWDGNAFYVSGYLLEVRGESTERFVVREGTVGIADMAIPFMSLREVVLPEGFSRICGEAFPAASLETVTLPSTLTYIAERAFASSKIKTVAIPASVKTIAPSAFEYCTELTQLTVANGVSEIGAGAFYGCSSLTEVVLPNSVQAIGYGAFAQCSSLSSLTLGIGLTTVGREAFRNAPMTSVTYMGNEQDWSRITFEGPAHQVSFIHATVICLGFAAGDVNTDGVIDHEDERLLRAVILERATLSAEARRAADCNRDGTLNSRDIVSVLQRIYKK